MNWSAIVFCDVLETVLRTLRFCLFVGTVVTTQSTTSHAESGFCREKKQSLKSTDTEFALFISGAPLDPSFSVWAKVRIPVLTDGPSESKAEILDRQTPLFIDYPSLSEPSSNGRYKCAPAMFRIRPYGSEWQKIADDVAYLKAPPLIRRNSYTMVKNSENYIAKPGLEFWRLSEDVRWQLSSLYTVRSGYGDAARLVSLLLCFEDDLEHCRLVFRLSDNLHFQVEASSLALSDVVSFSEKFDQTVRAVQGQIGRPIEF